MQLRDRKILVTGAAGFIGSHLSDRLAEANELVLVDDFSVGLRENLDEAGRCENVQVVEADIRDRERMLALCEGIDVVFHLAISCLRTSLGRPFLSHDVNAGGTLSVCLAARDREVPRLVYVSSSEVYGTAQTVPMSESHPCDPMTVYGASKLAGELYALACWRTYGLPVTVARPFNSYGPREPYSGQRAEVIPRFILQLETGRSPVVYGDGTQTRDFTFVEDTVQGLLQIAELDEAAGEVVNVAFGQEASILRVAELLCRITGRDGVEVVHDSPRPGDVDRHFADVSKAKRLFGFQPRVDLEMGLEHTVEWFRREHIAERVADGEAGTPNW